MHASRTRLVATLLTLALVAAACSSAGDGSGTRSSPSVNAASAPLLPTDVYALPQLSFEQFQQLLRQLRGTPVVVNIWGSWCGPCRVEGPALVRAAKRYGTRVQFLGVDILDDRGPARDFIAKEGYPYPSVFDPGGEIRRGLGFLGQPDTAFYSRSGRLAAQASGAIDDATLAANIRKIL